MGIFGRKREIPQPEVTIETAVQMEAMTLVRGVGRHQELLAGPARRVKVELMAWEKGDTITAKIGGERVGEIDFSPALHRVLLALRRAGQPPVVVDGEVRHGDHVSRYLEVALPDPVSLTLIAPKTWAPAESPINVHMTTHYQDALRSLYRPSTRRREAQVSFREHGAGKYAGSTEGVVTLDDKIVGELSAGASEKWSIILEDRKAGIPGRLMITIWPGHGGQPKADNPFYVDAIYKRQAPTDG